MSDLDISDTIKAKSDQLNAVDLAQEVTVKITRVEKKRSEQPVVIHLDGYDGRPFKPCLSMRRILGFIWGTNAATWTGRSMTLYCDSSVMWAGKPVGGIRISHLSHMNEQSTEVPIAISKHKREMYTVNRLDLNINPESMINSTTSNDELDGVVKNLRASMQADKFASLKDTVTAKRASFS